MEKEMSYEKKMLITELLTGMELAKQLRTATTSCAQSNQILLHQIVCSFEKALFILKPNQSAPDSPNGSLKSDEYDNQDGSKKRKMMPRWTSQVKVSLDSGLEGPQEDGYSWRKYGQKDILAAKYPRSYYRCTYRKQNCYAVKQVQRRDEDPTIFDITYRGTHTCSQNTVLPPPSPQKQEEPSNYHQSQDIQNQQIIPAFSFPSSSIDNIGMSTAPEQNYYSEFAHYSELDLTGFVSEHTSATNSPVIDMDFPLDPNFSFNPAFFF